MNKQRYFILSFLFIIFPLFFNCGHLLKKSQNSIHTLNRNELYKKRVYDTILYISTSTEREELAKLTTPDELVQFLHKFWAKRDPTPATSENEFKTEHLRRLKFVNLNFQEPRKEGWETDRGRVYILYGPPDEIEIHPYFEYIKRAKRIILSTEIWTYHQVDQIWHPENRYDNIYAHGLMFLFADKNGLGNYEQIYSNGMNEMTTPWLFF